MKKQQLYKLHRWLSIVCLLPVIMWCLSGIMHPVMGNWFKIKPAKRFIVNKGITIDSTYINPSAIKPPKGYNTVTNFKLVTIAGNIFYQIENKGSYDYFNAKTGVYLQNGDELYAKQLARYFLGDESSDILNVEVITDFTPEYKIINRLLPVYKISFNRLDKMDVYVHTGSSKLGTLNDSFRKGYMWFFSMFHNWDFLGHGQSTFKITAVFIFSVIVFITGVLGLIIYFVNRKKFKARKTTTSKLKPRNRHRKLAVITSIFLLMFSFSGAYHAFQKYEPYVLHQLKPNQKISLSSLESFHKLSHLSKPISNVSLIQFDDNTYYNVSFSGRNAKSAYYNTATLQPLSEGSKTYAIKRASAITGVSKNNVKSTELITKFNHEYGFINKRLPVVKVAYNTPDNLTAYIEPSSGIPGAIIRDKNRYEGLSFAFLHKYHMFDALGKSLRDTIMTLAALCVMLIALTGLVVFVKGKYWK